jgi:hypothetical protein
MRPGRYRKEGVLDDTRGHVTIRDRAALERHACECYAQWKRNSKRSTLTMARPAPDEWLRSPATNVYLCRARIGRSPSQAAT